MSQPAVTPTVVPATDAPPAVSPLTGRAVLVTGGSGAFGQTFVRHALDAGARKVVILSRGEATQAAMRAAFADDRLRFLIGDVRDAHRMLDACRGIDDVIHAAALKRVEVCEADPAEAIATNVVGTGSVARACVERGVERAVLLSTDKAAAPNTLYGMTKAAGERLWIASNVYAAGLPTRFAATRYGNVMNSTGSVVPLWKAQAAAGEALTLTDDRCSRFWMSMASAVELVCLTLATMRGGEVFVPKLGAALVRDLAEAVAPHARTRETGLRPAEKLHELLITPEEASFTHDAGTHYVIEPATRTWGDVVDLTFPKVPADFAYRSDTAPRLALSVLREMAA